MSVPRCAFLPRLTSERGFVCHQWMADAWVIFDGFSARWMRGLTDELSDEWTDHVPVGKQVSAEGVP